MILLIDWGNTYIKSLQVDSLETVSLSKTPVQTFTEPTEIVAQLDSVFERILIASVRSDADNQLLLNLLAQKGDQVEFAQSSLSACGVSCAYSNPTQLGVDRWLGVIAAAQLATEIAVISIGSAITLDIVKHGNHLGGQIIPGRRLLLATLKQTGRVQAADKPILSPDFVLGKSTTECVHFGVNALIAGYLSLAISETERVHKIHQFIVTGGGGDFWSKQLGKAGRVVTYRPALVFEGLSQLYGALQ